MCQVTLDNMFKPVAITSVISFKMPPHPAIAAFQKGRLMFTTIRKNLFLAGILAASFALFGCNSTSSDDVDDRDRDSGGSASLTYDGQAWKLAAGVCAGSTDFISSFNFTRGETHMALYIQGRDYPAPGTYTVSSGVTDADMLVGDEVAVSLSDLNFNVMSATGGTITISRVSGSSLRFASESVAFEGGKDATFDVTTTIGCSAS
jgi:hypothetical protein